MILNWAALEPGSTTISSISAVLRDSVVWDSEEIPDSCVVVAVAVPTGTGTCSADDRLYRVRGPQCLSCRVVSFESELCTVETEGCGYRV